MAKERVSFAAKKLFDETIRKLMNEGLSETEARLTVAKWIDKAPAKKG